MEYTFTLKYQLPADAPRAGALLEHLYDAGCDDAVVGVGRPGRMALEFSREAADAEAAVVSAMEDVRRAVPSARLIEMAPDLVGLSDVAELVGVSRQAIRKWMLVHADAFPAPVHEGSASIWHLADLLAWLRARGTHRVDERVDQVALVAMHVNAVKEGVRLPDGVAARWASVLR